MKKYFFTILFLFFLNPNFVFAFNNTIVHPGISAEAVDLYLRSGHEGSIDTSQIASIMKGAENEDTDPRYLNHFYNPYNNQSFLEAFGVPAPNAKEWAFFQQSFSGDYSIPTILRNYREGNKKRAFEGIGHILHLIQDMGTPAHVRIDPHPPGDEDGLETATEAYAKFPHIKENYSKKDISNIFDEFAKYTYSNFYSDDRIDNNIKIEKIEKVVESDGNEYFYGLKDGHVVCELKKENNENICILNEFIYQYYWQALYPKTVTYSASAIDWFMSEFEKIDQEKAELSFWKKSLNKIVATPLNIANSMSYVWGDTYLATRDGLATGFNGVGYFVSGMGDAVYYSGLALGDASDKIIKSSVEIAREGAIGTLGSIGEASLLGGNAIEGLYNFGDKSSGKVLSAFEEGADNVSKIVKEHTPLVKADTFPLENGVAKEEIPEEVIVLGLEGGEQGGIETHPTSTPLQHPTQEGNNNGTWIPRNNVLLFSGGGSSALPEEEEVVEAQDLSIITLEIFNIDSSSREVTSSTSIGVDIDFGDLENIQYYLSESTTTGNISWSDIIPDNFILSGSDGQKKVYLFVRDDNSQIILDSTIRLDISSPVIEIISGPPDYSSSTEASFLFRANCLPTLFEYSFNNNIYQESDLSVSISEGMIFGEGSNILNVRIEDEFGRKATSSYVWVVDVSSPQVFFNKASTTEAEIILSWKLSSTTPELSPIDYFELEKYLDSELSDSYIFTSDIFSTRAPFEEKLSFRIRAIDKAGNIGDWDAFLTPIEKEKNLLISEVGIRGEEFIELYNPRGDDINISDWCLSYYSSTRDWGNPYRQKKFEQGAVIKSNGYFLLSVLDDTEADDSFLYAKGFLNDNDGSVVLFVSDPKEASSSEIVNIKVDAVGWGNPEYVFEGEAVIISGDFNSIERKARAESTNESMNNIEEDFLLGNEYDTDNNLNDFVLREITNPQNSLSGFEPRAPIMATVITDLAIENIGVNEANISWSSTTNSFLNNKAYFDLRYMKSGGDCDIENEWENISENIITNTNINIYQYTIGNLEEEADYCLGIKVFNGETWSDISNIINFKTVRFIKELTRFPKGINSRDPIHLTKAGSPYILTRATYIRGAGIVIDPGVVVKIMDDYRAGGGRFPVTLLMDSPMIAIGTEDEPIIFTSDKDDSVAGDTNHDGSDTVPVPGSWGSLEFYSEGSVLDNVIIRYSGRDIRRGFITITKENNKIVNSRFENVLGSIEIRKYGTSTNPIIISNDVFVNSAGGFSIYSGADPIIENITYE